MRILTLLLLSVAVFAGPPMLSNDPFVPAVDEVELNIAIQREHVENQDIVTEAPIIDFNYGVYENLQLTLEGAYVSEGSKSDWGGTKVALKYMFYDDGLFAMALYPQYSSYPAQSIFNEGETYEISAPINVTLSENLDWVIDIAYIIPLHIDTHFEFGSYLKYKYEKHAFYLEVFAEGEAHQEHFFVFGNVGYSYEFIDGISFLISYGKHITENKEEHAHKAYSALQFVF